MPGLNEKISRHVEMLSSFSNVKTFLGREFLTWLWYRVESNQNPIEICFSDGIGKHEVTFWVDDKVVLESSATNVHQHSLKGGNPSQSAEAAAALQSGKYIKEMKIGIHVAGIGDFTAIFDCRDLSPRSLKLPESSREPDEAQAETPSSLHTRITQTEIFLYVIDTMFSNFLDARIDNSWENEELGKIRNWIKRRHASRDKVFH